MRKKIKTDSVEELFEIVKAVQNGEDPEEMLRRKEAESAPEADSPKSIPEADIKIKKQSSIQEEQEEDSFWDDSFDDEFEKNLKADGQKGINMKPVLGAFRAGVQKTASFFQNLTKKSSGDEEDYPDSEEEKEPKKKKTIKKRAAKPEELSEKEAAKESGELKESETPEESGDPETAGELKKPEKPEGSGDPETAEELKTSEDTKDPETSGEKKDPEEPAAVEKSEDEILIDRLLDRDDLHPEPEKEEELAKDQESPEKNQKKKEKKKIPQIHFDMGGIRDFFSGLPEKLRQKGIHRKELFMIGAGIVLIILIFTLIGRAVSVSISDKKKAEHVEADPGLTVTVENEPQQWCSQAKIELRFRAKNAVISRVTINGKEYIPDEMGMVTAEVSDYMLEAFATTDNEELKAVIEIPKIDAQPPVVQIERQQDQVVVTAADARSSVTGIWYAAVEEGAYNGLPSYEKYSEPFVYEENMIYYFYAEDAAGNKSKMIETTTEPAEELALEQEKISLFPNETGYIQLNESPEGALLNNLKFESGNTDVVTVDGNGAVTAVGEGSTVVKVSADGLDEVSCSVEVSNQRTVTVSAIGDCTLGSDESFNTTTDFNAYDMMNGHSYFFQNVKDILANDDATFANLEGTFTTETTREIKQYAFKGDPSYTDILKLGSVEVVTLANNHSSDYGAKSLSDTQKYLSEAKIDYCTGDQIAIREVNGIKTAFIGIYVLDEGMGKQSQVEETISSAKSQGAQLVIVGFHWGSEKATQPDETQQALAHLAVDCGADLVVGHHPHVLQGIENYNGKYIVYSLGNFCFGGNSTPSDMDTMIFRQTFTVTKDNVLTDSQVEVIPCTISSTAGYNNYQPTPAQGTEADRIVGRVNEYSSAFGQTFTASSGLE